MLRVLSENRAALVFAAILSLVAVELVKEPAELPPVARVGLLSSEPLPARGREVAGAGFVQYFGGDDGQLIFHGNRFYVSEPTAKEGVKESFPSQK